MKFNERRSTAAALVSSVSLLASFGLAKGLDAAAEDQASATPKARNGQKQVRQMRARKAPSSILIVRRSHPTITLNAATPVPASTGAVASTVPATGQAPVIVAAPAAPVPAAPAAPAPAPPAPPPAPVTRSS